ncbi:MAG: carboxypeptidase-like regulatory domain-containing protein [Ferruginibacter sp.]
MFVAVAFASFAHSMEVTGKVTDLHVAPIANASVLEKGTRDGFFANEEGVFTITVKQSARLVISAVAYLQKEKTASKNVRISLEAESKNLSEVIVTGTGVGSTRKKLGISVESISADKLPAAPTASIDQALVGKIPGAQISSVDGTPGPKQIFYCVGLTRYRMAQSR